MSNIPDGISSNDFEQTGAAREWASAQQIIAKDRGVLLNQQARIIEQHHWRELTAFAIRAAVIVVGILIVMAGWHFMIG